MSSTDPKACPPRDEVVALLQGRLGAGAIVRLQRHLAGCEACRAVVSKLTHATDAADSPNVSASRGARSSGKDALALDAALLLVGKKIGRRYRLVRLLGTGGMGSVYEARDAKTGASVAVKVVNPRLLESSSEAGARFRREARAAASLESPNIVRTLDSGVDEDSQSLYLAMEYLVGEDLQQRLDRSGPLRPVAALRVGVQALRGLECAHAAGIIHQDIKPANLFLARAEDGTIQVKLLDFGIAKIVEPLGVVQTTGLTNTGGLLGSPLYMSPEQVQNSKAVDARTDVWSLGSTLYALLTGMAPHKGVDSVGQLIRAICSTPAGPIRALAPWVTPDVAVAVHRALAIRPDARYPSAAAMLETVVGLIDGDETLGEDLLSPLAGADREPFVPGELPTKALPTPPPARTRRGLLVATAIVALSITAGAAYHVARLQRSPP
jgi:serine/threonine-protein kinase